MPDYKGIIISHWTVAADSPEEAAATLRKTGAEIQESYATDFLVDCDAVAGAILPEQAPAPKEETLSCPTTPSS